MALATIKDCDAGKVRGEFIERTYKKRFEFGVRDHDWREAFAPEFDMVVYCGPFSEPRAAQIFKTTVRVVTDEANDGSPIVCVWKVRNLRHYGIDL